MLWTGCQLLLLLLLLLFVLSMRHSLRGLKPQCAVYAS
jgi:hypothetical protein